MARPASILLLISFTAILLAGIAPSALAQNSCASGLNYCYNADGTQLTCCNTTCDKCDLSTGQPKGTPAPGANYLRVVGEYTPVPSARHSPYPAHLNPASNDTLIGDYVAYSNNLFNIDGITDPGPGNREYIGLSTGVCTVIQQPSSEDSNAVYQCYTSLQFQSGKYAPSSIFLAIVYSDSETPDYAIIGGSGYFKRITGTATQLDETPFAEVSENGEYYITLEYYLP
jgi:hypothetical protein